MIVGLSDDSWLRLNPPHPGGIIRDGYLDASEEYPGMTVAAAAAALGVNQADFLQVVNERRPITIDLAMKMEACGWGTADGWMRLQTKYDIAQARKRLNQPLASAPAVRAEKQAQAEAA